MIFYEVNNFESFIFLFDSHHVDLVFRNLERVQEAFKSLVKELVYGWRSTHPDLLKLASVDSKLTLDVLRGPARQLGTFSLRQSNSGCKVVQLEGRIKFFKSFNQLESDSLCSALEGNVKVKLETSLIEIHLRREGSSLRVEDVHN